ncbi:GGDEF domain-containing protein [Rhodoferax saidenbachensis]|uniref:diguanylate cyclase n=1 Tax=Rhodoferax saidenbachensis TaxID=1484693 RepID=A0A1P8K639_9BURK|nr:GGDEF domain-containing protein [Rhodoferax saidenbachensis]APW41470.1 GGDEF domain-containing protein [Rhodoferax saidenbachensis]
MIDIHALMERAPADRAQYRWQRTIGDFYQRALAGSVFYALGCLVTAWFGGYFSRYPALVAAVLLLFALLTYLRRTHRPPQDLNDRLATKAWWTRHWWMVHGGSIVWCGFFAAVGVIEAGPSLVFSIAALCTIAYTSAACEVYSFDRKQALLVVVLIQLPAMALFLVEVPPLRALVIVLAVYFVYQLAHIRRRGREYDAQVDVEYALITSRAEVQRLSQQDALTGLANRREYETTFGSHWHAAARQRTALALIVMDLDHFKRVNDTHGHSAGDACLRHVAVLMQERFRRGGDLVARIGGEEFAVVLPDTSAEEAVAMAQALRDDLVNHPLPWESHAIDMTASIGVDAIRWDIDTSPQDSYRRIDDACYAAKGNGRNQVVQAGPSP